MSETIGLVQQAKQGNHDAFVVLVGSQKEKLRRIAGYYVKNNADIEDIVQDAIISAYSSLHKLRSAESFDGWLSRIAVNRALTCLQRQKRVLLTDEPKDVAEAAFLVDHEASLDLEAAIAKLGPQLQQLIYLKYARDLTQQQIASLLDIPLGTVKTSLRKGLKELREQLQGKEEANRTAGRLKELERDLVALRDQLKQQAESMFHIPSDYELLIEDFRENGTSPQAGGEANFVWVMPGTDCGIAITLSEQGSLVDYSIDLEQTARAQSLPQEQLKVFAERFIEDHYPRKLSVFPYLEVDWRTGGCWFQYQQTAMGLPLPFTGFRINVHGASGKIQDFKYFGEAEVLSVPGELRDPIELLAEIRDNLVMELKYVVLSQGVYEGGNDEIKLVYEPASFVQRYPAALESGADANEASLANISDGEAKVAGTDMGGQNEYVDVSSTESLPATEEVYLPIDLSQFERTNWPKWGDRSLEEWVGVDLSRFERIREAEMSDTVIGVVWQKKNRDLSRKDRSWDAYFADRNEKTIKAKLDKKSRRLLGFMHFTGDEDTVLQELSRKECLQIALEYVQALTPGMLPFLRLHVDEDTNEEPGDGRKMVNLVFRAYAGELPVGFESTTVAVNRKTGKVVMFMASSLQPEDLAGLYSQPAIDASQARDIYMNRMELQLKWETQYSAEKSGRQYKLVYCMVESETGRPPRLLDAQTGNVYCSAF